MDRLCQENLLIQQWLLGSYIIWRTNYAGGVWHRYTSETNVSLPVWAIVDPHKMNTSIVTTTGLIPSASFLNLLKTHAALNLPLAVTNVPTKALSINFYQVKGIARTNAVISQTITNSPIVAVMYRLNGIGSFQQATPTVESWKAWLANVMLPQGTNTFESYVQYAAGNSWTNKVSLTTSADFIVNNNVIRIDDNSPASPYPSSITVTGVAGVVRNVAVTLWGVTHSYPSDIQILLVGPGGQKVVLMSNAGTTMAPNQIIAFAGDAPGSLPQSGQITGGIYKPTDYPPDQVFVSPAPAGPYGTTLGVFTNTDPNGVWSLYVLDNSTSDDGQIAGGWSLSLDTVQAPTITLLPQSQKLVANDTAVLTVTAEGTSPLSYRWSLNGTNLLNGSRITGATNQTLTISPVQRSDAGSYTVLVSNYLGTITSVPAAMVSVAPIGFNQSYVRPDGSVQLNLRGEQDSLFDLYASSDLKVWKTITTFTNSGGTFQFIDPAAAGLAHRFYRAILK